ncbi:apolipoprotein N-acyltransferase [Microbacterium gorillae]|uniref:apolipoprotein N-acyltransferase n=1 Tax=Microbacterium gorillae TaxID=1231063 RepID=UPI00389937B1
MPETVPSPPRDARRARRRERRGAPLLPLWAAVLVALAAGPLLAWAFPPVGAWPLAFVAVALVLVTNIGRSAWAGVLVGFLFGISFHLVMIVWITRYLGPIPWFALTGLESVLFAVGTVPIVLAYRWLPRLASGRWARLVALPVLVAGLWTAREIWFGSWPYTGFPWARIGMSMSSSPLAETASWVGVSGLTFLIVLTAAMAVQAVRLFAAADRTWFSVVPVAATLAVLILTPQFPTTPAGTMRVGAVQGNGPAGYFDDRAPNAVLQAQLDATVPIMDDKLDLLLWPEGSVDSDPLQNQTTARTLIRLSEQIDAPLLVNAATQRDADIFNTSILWDGAAGAVQMHDKRNPVPFGEYVPDRKFFEPLAPDLIGLIGREYTPGTNAPIVSVKGVGVGLAICFDVIYDEVIQEGARDGAQVYMFQTNNADFRGTSENLQQLAFARMRAIETGRSVVNISTVGTSQVIAPDGTTIDHLVADEPGAMVTDVPLRTGLTPAVLLGNVLSILLYGGSLLALVAVGVTVLVRRRGAVPVGDDAS